MTRLVIANRGEIARRILRAARERGLQIAVISTVEDIDAPVRREADAVLEVSSFLAMEEIVAVAQGWGATLLHPGYGFLSENADFARAVEAAGIAFVGPTSENMVALGGKESAKAFARLCGVPTLDALLSNELAYLAPEDWAAELEARGIVAPFLVKASGGGGGRGMRVVGRLQDLPEAVRRASEEALASFSDGTVFIERYLIAPRHVEIQVFGDGRGGGVFLGERECSLQRRHQKVLEEAPSSVVDATLREVMGRAALALVWATHYRGAGTVEFLLDDEGRFFFLEMNTRLQVEHPVTEQVYGVDLVQAQLDLAAGRWPEAMGDPTQFAVPRPHGVALEARVLAEDPRQGFFPTPGPLRIYREPKGEHIRVDSGVVQSGRVNDRFDSLIAKVIVWGENRAQAWARLSEALEAFVILGCTTNLPFLQALSRHPDVRGGCVSTDWIAAHLAELNAPLLPEALDTFLKGDAFHRALDETLRGLGQPKHGPAARFAALSHSELQVGGPCSTAPFRVSMGVELGEFFFQHPVLAPTALRGWACRLPEGGLHFSMDGETLRLAALEAKHRQAEADSDGLVRAPMAGKVVEICVAVGDVVEESQILFILESMKMQMEVRAPKGGRVVAIRVLPDQILPGPEVMAEME
ncbi:MAG: biotin carboxylase N-terminal domain-containing protein [Holophaga sp.]|nr:biotin carboxylase N-terminal domain-containing protein [Holophaga sp.]